MRLRKLLVLLAAIALIAAACGSDGDSTDSAATTAAAAAATTAAPAADSFVLGVSNTTVGNGWREQMICAIKAEALSSGVISEIKLANREAGVTEQIADLQGLIAQGVDAIVFNPVDPEALNPVIEEGAAQGIVMVAVDNRVTTTDAYVVSNDQVAYGANGAKWLFEELGGEGKVVYMRGIDGVGADTDRDTGFQAELANYPGIEVVEEVFTDWSPATGAQQALEIMNSTSFDGIWTSGIDYTIVPQFDVAGVEYTPVVGADNNGFLEQMIELEGEGFVGAAVTNPPAIGGVATAIAIDLLKGNDHPQQTILDPAVFDMANNSDDVNRMYIPDLDVGSSSYIEIAPWTTYDAAQVVDCKGPGE
ncbi:MAG: substrate-binding domain-containing protein [Acidimicrobiales bacterium]